MRKFHRITALIVATLFAFAAYAQTAVIQSVENVSNKVATYAASSTFTLAATPTVVWQLIGSATKTVYVKRINISCNKTTAGYSNVHLIKYSTAATGGTAVATTELPLDSANVANTAQASHYTAEPTPGTAVGTVSIRHLAFPAPAGTTDIAPSFFTFGDERDQYIVLRGVAQNVALNMAAATLTGAVCSVSTVWMER